MEVHHHSHTARKKWVHYFWEFLMLFLAVFCGFLAENIREHRIEQHRAKQFALSLLNDLKEDTAALNMAIGYGNKKDFKKIQRKRLQKVKSRWRCTNILRTCGIL